MIYWILFGLFLLISVITWQLTPSYYKVQKDSYHTIAVVAILLAILTYIKILFF